MKVVVVGATGNVGTSVMEALAAEDVEALGEMLEGMAEGSGGPTPPLTPDNGRSRLAEIATGVGERG